MSNFNFWVIQRIRNKTLKYLMKQLFLQYFRSKMESPDLFFRHSESAWFRFRVSDFLFLLLCFSFCVCSIVFLILCLFHCIFWLRDFDFVIVVQVKFLAREHISQAESRDHVGWPNKSEKAMRRKERKKERKRERHEKCRFEQCHRNKK